MINYFPGKRKISEHVCFIHNGSYFLTVLSVYEGGGIECWGKLTKQQFLEKIDSGFITIDLPDNVELKIGDQGFIVKQAETSSVDGTIMFKHKWITKESFIMDVLDSVDVGIGNRSASEICYDAYYDYMKNSNDQTLNRLRIAYDNVPEHNRKYVLGDQDLKDFPIRRALGL